MKYRIESPEDNIIYEAEKSEKEFQQHCDKFLSGETNEVWHLIDNWSKKYPII